MKTYGIILSIPIPYFVRFNLSYTKSLCFYSTVYYKYKSVTQIPCNMTAYSKALVMLKYFGFGSMVLPVINHEISN